MIVKFYADKKDEHPAVYAGNISVVYNDDNLGDLTIFYGDGKVVTWETAHVEFARDGNYVAAYQEWETTDDA